MKVTGWLTRLDEHGQPQARGLISGGYITEDGIDELGHAYPIHRPEISPVYEHTIKLKIWRRAARRMTATIMPEVLYWHRWQRIARPPLATQARREQHAQTRKGLHRNRAPLSSKRQRQHIRFNPHASRSARLCPKA